MIERVSGGQVRAREGQAVTNPWSYAKGRARGGKQGKPSGPSQRQRLRAEGGQRSNDDAVAFPERNGQESGNNQMAFPKGKGQGWGVAQGSSENQGRASWPF